MPARFPRKGFSVKAIRREIEGHAETLFHEAFGPPLRAGATEWRAKDNGAIAMSMRGQKRGVWFDHSAGQGGDLLDLVAITRCGLTSARDNFPGVLEEARAITGAWREAAGTDPKHPARDRGHTAASADSAAEAEQAYQAALIRRVRGWTKPVANSPAQAYLAARNITRWPDAELAWLPPIPRLPVHAPECHALLIWARDADGRQTGGQRILLEDTGARARMDVSKPSFGCLRGHPARFPALCDGGGPLIVAEGPETALAIRQATGHETWAVFGVSGWKSLPLARAGRDRKVILAPDRDAPKSPAGRAFARAVLHYLEQGCNVLVAEAPEPTGSKRDLADTLQNAGPEAVRAAIAAAQPPDPDEMTDRADPDAPPRATPATDRVPDKVPERREAG